MQLHESLEFLAGGGIALEQRRKLPLVVFRLDSVGDPIEEVESGGGKPHAGASSASVLATQSRRDCRILRSICDSAQGVVWRASASALTEQSGS